MAIYFNNKAGVALQAFNRAMLENPENESLHDGISRGVGHITSKTVTITTDTNTQLFQITGHVHIHRLYGVFTAEDACELTAASFDLFPTGGAAIPITSAAGTTLVGSGVNTLVMRKGVATDPITVKNASLGGVIDQIYQGSDVFNAFIVTQKSGTDTFIRFSTSGGTITSVTIIFYVEYTNINGGTLVAV